MWWLVLMWLQKTLKPLAVWWGEVSRVTGSDRFLISLKRKRRRGEDRYGQICWRGMTVLQECVWSMRRIKRGVDSHSLTEGILLSDIFQWIDYHLSEVRSGRTPKKGICGGFPSLMPSNNHPYLPWISHLKSSSTDLFHVACTELYESHTTVLLHSPKSAWGSTGLNDILNTMVPFT